MTCRLGVNIDHIATVRQARRATYPDPIEAARVAEQAGAQQITCHLRGDRRHIQDRDVTNLEATIRVELNLEMAATEEMQAIAIRLLGNRPKRHRITLVPERAGEVTTEGGLDVLGQREVLASTVAALTASGLAVALFIDPLHEQVRAAASIRGVDQLELNTARYSEIGAEDLPRLRRAADATREAGIVVAAGHGLTLENVPPLLQAVPSIEELNIGHSIVARALFVGFDRAVRELLELLTP